MTSYTHELSEIDRLCGVTLEDVARELARGVFRQDGAVFVVADETGPAVAASTARAAFKGEEVEYLGRSIIGQVYGLTD